MCVLGMMRKLPGRGRVNYYLLSYIPDTILRAKTKNPKTPVLQERLGNLTTHLEAYLSDPKA